MLQLITTLSLLQVGDVVSVRKQGGVVEHFGLVVGYDWTYHQPVVVSASGLHGRVIIQTLSEFCGDQTHKHYRVVGRHLSDQEIARRALSALGTKYEVFRTNCEHFIRYAHGLPQESPQVRAWLATFVVGVTVAAAFRQ